MFKQLDFARAFDSVNVRNHSIKSDAYGVYQKIVELVHSFLTHRSFRVRVLQAFSLPFSANSVDSKGSVIGPLLFLQFINDLPDLLQGKVLLYTDDVKMVFLRSNYNNTELSLRSAWDWAVT